MSKEGEEQTYLETEEVFLMFVPIPHALSSCCLSKTLQGYPIKGGAPSTPSLPCAVTDFFAGQSK